MMLYLSFPRWLSPQIAPGLPLRWYGAMYVVAFVITFLLFRHEASRSGLSRDRDEIATFFYWVVLGALLGGRLFYVFLIGDEPLTFLRRPWLIVWPFRDGQYTGIQGMNYYGGLIGVIAAVVLFGRIRRVSVLEWGDTLAIVTPLGYTLGRLGNFINGELAGRVTTVSWGVVFPQVPRFSADDAWVPGFAARAGIDVPTGTLMVNLPRHPSQLYEGLLEGLVLWLILWLVFRPHRLFPGAVIALYLVGYAIARFICEYFRAADDVRVATSIFQISPDQIISLAMFAAGIALFIVLRAVAPNEGVVETFDQTE